VEGSGPAWLGIGAARSGSTWFAGMLTSHSGVRQPDEGVGEQRRLDGSIEAGLDLEGYGRLFDGAGRIGEWNSHYLSLPWVAEVAAQVCREDAPILCILRDPVDRFRSELRSSPVEDRTTVAQAAAWGGMYGAHFKAWREAFTQKRFVVMQYEAVVEDPQPYVERIWRMLGLGSEWSEVDPTARTDATSPVDWDWPEGLRERLVKLYRPQVERVAAMWGLDPRLWPNFAPRSG